MFVWNFSSLFKYILLYYDVERSNCLKALLKVDTINGLMQLALDLVDLLDAARMTGDGYSSFHSRDKGV